MLQDLYLLLLDVVSWEMNSVARESEDAPNFREGH